MIFSVLKFPQIQYKGEKMFPLIPLPQNLVPMLGGLHGRTAIGGAFLSAFIGVTLLVALVPSYNNIYGGTVKGKQRSLIRFGVGLIIFSLASLSTGLYIWILMFLGFIIFVIWVLIRGVGIAFSKD